MMSWLQIKNNADNTAIDEIFIYGEIGDWWEELDATSLANKVKQSQGDTIRLRVNSGGGNVFTALSLYSLLKTSGKTIEVNIDGICASAATFFPCAASKVTMTLGGQMMIHDPLAGVYGQSKDLRKMADILDKVGGSIAMLYAEKTGKDVSDLLELMAEETWLDAHEAMEMGFVSDILETMDIAACTGDVIAMSSKRLKNIPQLNLNHVKSNNTQSKGGETMDLTTLKASHADVYAQAKQEGVTEAKAKTNEAVTAERQRIQDIQDIAKAGQDDLVKTAINNGQSAGEFAIAQAKAEKALGEKHIENRNAETAAVAAVVDTPAVDDADVKAKAEEAAFFANFKENVNKGIK